MLRPEFLYSPDGVGSHSPERVPITESNFSEITGIELNKLNKNELPLWRYVDFREYGLSVFLSALNEINNNCPLKLSPKDTLLVLQTLALCVCTSENILLFSSRTKGEIRIFGTLVSRSTIRNSLETALESRPKNIFLKSFLIEQGQKTLANPQAATLRRKVEQAMSAAKNSLLQDRTEADTVGRNVGIEPRHRFKNQ